MTKPRYRSRIHRAKIARQCQRRFAAWRREFDEGARRAMERIKKHGNPWSKIDPSGWPEPLGTPITRLFVEPKTP